MSTELGRKLYEDAYAKTRGMYRMRDGSPMIPWETLPTDIQEQWERQARLLKNTAENDGVISADDLAAAHYTQHQATGMVHEWLENHSFSLQDGSDFQHFERRRVQLVWQPDRQRYEGIMDARPDALKLMVFHGPTPENV